MFELRPYRNNNHMTTYDPFRDMEALERAFFGNRDFLGDVGTFKTDIQDKGDHYLLEADLPGMKKEDIAIDIDGDNLTIKAERRNEHEEKDKSYVRCERSYGSYQRAFDISGVEVANISAQYNDGVLKLNMPKKSADMRNCSLTVSLSWKEFRCSTLSNGSSWQDANMMLRRDSTLSVC